MKFYKFETNQKRNLFWNQTEAISKPYTENLQYKAINVYPELQGQKFFGFGGAFTEASGICYKELPHVQKQEFLNDYFSENGLNYTWGRLPIGSTDFSKKSYSYSEKENLSDFSIKKDERFITPLIKDALNINPNITFVASPWSPPKFMKTNKKLILGGKLKEEYRKLYSEYFVKYLLSYKNLGIDIPYITVQNEANAVQVWESCVFSSNEEATFIKEFLYPALKENNLDTEILIWDHNKEKLYSRAKDELNLVFDEVAGVAYHYYSGDHFENIKNVHETYPEKLLIHTEGCCGFSKIDRQSEKAVNNELQNAEIYAHDIIGDLNSGSNAYIDWNLLLNHKGGPNHKFNFCSSPIMLEKGEKNYIKTYTYYYIGHFSKFIKPNSIRLKTSKYTDDINVTSFKNPDDSISVVLFNKTNQNKEYNLNIGNKEYIHDNLDSHAIVSYIIKEDNNGN